MKQPAPSSSETVQVHVPTGEFGTSRKQLAKRLATLRGARIGVLDNCKEFADIVLRGVADVLQRDHGVAQIEFRRKGYPGSGAGAEFLQNMARSFDAVINGVGH